MAHAQPDEPSETGYWGWVWQEESMVMDEIEGLRLRHDIDDAWALLDKLALTLVKLEQQLEASTPPTAASGSRPLGSVGVARTLRLAVPAS